VWSSASSVFGKFGLRQGPALHKGLDAPQRIARDARRVTAPTLFHLQWHDEIFPRDGQLALFDGLGSRDKQLIGYAGTHAETKPTAIILWRDFISRHLVSSAGVGPSRRSLPRRRKRVDLVGFVSLQRQKLH
jgi:hypothetical protein